MFAADISAARQEHLPHASSKSPSRRLGHPFVLHLNLRFAKPDGPASIFLFARSGSTSTRSHVIIDENWDLSSIAIAGKILFKNTQRFNQLAGPVKLFFTADDVNLLIDFLPYSLGLWADIADKRKRIHFLNFVPI